ncbi:hypothetical protein ACFQU2_21560 [Siccirubricoccus deserti]
MTGNLVGRKADYALMTLHLLDESFSPNNPWPRWLLDGHGGLGAATFSPMRRPPGGLRWR